MHPLLDNLKSLSWEELQRQSDQIHNRMQIMRRNRIQNPLMWDQLEMMLESIKTEQQERSMILNSDLNPHKNKTVVINTDPLQDDADAEPQKTRDRTFKPIT